MSPCGFISLGISYCCQHWCADFLGVYVLNYLLFGSTKQTDRLASPSSLIVKERSFPKVELQQEKQDIERSRNLLPKSFLFLGLRNPEKMNITSDKGPFSKAKKNHLKQNQDLLHSFWIFLACQISGFRPPCLLWPGLAQERRNMVQRFGKELTLE